MTAASTLREDAKYLRSFYDEAKWWPIADRVSAAADEIERLRDRAVCSGCGGDVAESGTCLAKCGEGEMIPASQLPVALRAMREQRDEWRQEAMSL